MISTNVYRVNKPMAFLYRCNWSWSVCHFFFVLHNTQPDPHWGCKISKSSYIDLFQFHCPSSSCIVSLITFIPIFTMPASSRPPSGRGSVLPSVRCRVFARTSPSKSRLLAAGHANHQEISYQGTIRPYQRPNWFGQRYWYMWFVRNKCSRLDWTRPV